MMLMCLQTTSSPLARQMIMAEVEGAGPRSREQDSEGRASPMAGAGTLLIIDSTSELHEEAARVPTVP